MKRYVSTVMVFSLLSFILMGLIPNPGTAGTLEFNLVSYTPKNSWNYSTFESEWVNKINERAKGELVIKFRGGPETIAIFDQAKAVASGAIDVAFNGAGFYSRLIPGADLFRIPKLTAAQWRKDGTIEYLRELHEAKGIYFSGWVPPNKRYLYITSRMPLRNPEDMKGKKFACTPAGLAFFKVIGASPVKMAPSEFYAAVERGVTDGNWIGIDSYVISSHYEVAPNVIAHPITNSTVDIIINLRRWKALPDHLKKLIEEVQLQTEENWPILHAKEEARCIDLATSKGAKFIKWSSEDAKWLDDTYVEATWDYYEEIYGSEITNRFKQIWGFK